MVSLPEDDSLLGHCVSMPTRLGATTTVEVSVLGVRRAFTLEVGDRTGGMALTSSAPALVTFADFRPRAWSLGARAAASPF